LQLSALGEYYADILAVDAWVNGRAPSGQAHSLLCSKLMQREDRVKERVAYLARKRGVDPDILWLQILKGEAEPLDTDEIVIAEKPEDAS